MEGRAAAAEYDEAEGKFTLHCGTQGSWLVKELLAEQRLQAAAGEVPRGHARRRRRLRHEALPLRRVRAGLHGGAAPQAPGALDRGAERGLPVRHPRARQHHARRAGGRQGRQVPGAAHPQLRQHGRLSLHLRALHPDRGRHQGAGQRLRLQGDPRPRARRADQHRAGRRLPRRRPAGEQLPGRAADRRRGARAGHRPRSRSASATWCRRAPCPTPRRSASATTAATSRRCSTRRSASPTGPASPRARRSPSGAASGAASASPTTWRRPAAARRSAPRCASPRTTRWRCWSAPRAPARATRRPMPC